MDPMPLPRSSYVADDQPHPTHVRTPARVVIRDWVITLAGLCVITWTVTVLLMLHDLSQALSEVGTSEPTPLPTVTECVGEVPC